MSSFNGPPSCSLREHYWCIIILVELKYGEALWMNIYMQLCVPFRGTLMGKKYPPCVQQILLRTLYALGTGLTDYRYEHV